MQHSGATTNDAPRVTNNDETPSSSTLATPHHMPLPVLQQVQHAYLNLAAMIQQVCGAIQLQRYHILITFTANGKNNYNALILQGKQRAEEQLQQQQLQLQQQNRQWPHECTHCRMAFQDGALHKYVNE
jgi:hypothetical protein